MPVGVPEQGQHLAGLALANAARGHLVSETPGFRNPDVAAVYWGRVCPVIAAALCQHGLRYEFLLPVLRNAGVGSYAGRDADLHPVKQSDGRAGRGNRSLNGSV